jgi:orotate phosphoribosyltransferase
MSEMEKQLLALLKERSFRLGTFRLASADTSNYYIDGRMTTVSSKGAFLIGETIYERTHNLSIDAIGGLAVGAVPLATAAVVAYHQHGRAAEGFWVRDTEKGHGTQKVIEGNLKEKARVVIVDDVITRGNSSIKAIDAVRNIGCEIVMVLTLVDRLCGAGELFREHGIKNFQSLFTIRDFGVEPDTGASAGK